MNMPLPEKEKLLTMLTEINDKLEELELVLEASFSDLRTSLNNEELTKISVPEQRLSMIEENFKNINLISVEDQVDTNPNNVSRALKLEIGF